MNNRSRREKKKKLRLIEASLDTKCCSMFATSATAAQRRLQASPVSQDEMTAL